MKVRVLLLGAIVLFVLVVGYGALSARAALHSIDTPGAELDLTCHAEITGEREVTVNVWWKWTTPNRRPGTADQIVILGPESWCSMNEPNTRTPTASGTAGDVQFGVMGEAAQTVTSMVETGNVKAYAAIRPNEDGNMTVYLKTSADPVAWDEKGSVQYLMVARVPSPAQRPNFAERLLRMFGADRTQLFTVEKQMPLSPWMPNLICPGYVGEPYVPSLTVEDPNPDLEKVALGLFTDYLEYHQSPDQPMGQRLDDYIINDIRVHNGDANHFWFSIGFSVKPTSMNTSWLAGNGEIRFSGWIENKYLEMDVVRENNTFTMVGGGTGGHPIDPK